MAKTLDFNKLQKQYMTLILPDEQKTLLLIGTPTKNLMAELEIIQKSLEAVDSENDSAVIDDLYLACSKLMSANKAGIKITKAKLEKTLDIEDIVVFFAEYMDFVTSIADQKN